MINEIKVKKELLVLFPPNYEDSATVKETINAGGVPVFFSEDLPVQPGIINKRHSNKSLGVHFRKILSDVVDIKKLNPSMSVARIIVPYGTMVLNAGKGTKILYQVDSLPQAEKAIAEEKDAIILPDQCITMENGYSQFELFCRIVGQYAQCQTKVFVSVSAEHMHIAAAYLALGAAGLLLSLPDHSVRESGQRPSYFIPAILQAAYGQLRQARYLPALPVYRSNEVEHYVSATSSAQTERCLREGAKHIICDAGQESECDITLWDEQIVKILQRDKNLSKLYILFSGHIDNAVAYAFVDIMVTMMRLKGIHVGALSDGIAPEMVEEAQRLLTGLQDVSPFCEPAKPLDIAIVGMDCILPNAANIDEYWRNILLGRDCISEVDDHRWSKEVYFNQDTDDTDFTCSKWGGFIPSIVFDPLEFGLMPQSIRSIEPVQLLSLLVAKRAMEDAGYSQTLTGMEDASVIFGANGLSELGTLYSHRIGVKGFFGEVPEALEDELPRMDEYSFAGLLPNIIAGRIANRLNFGGRNYTVDAACASSLVALDLACQELASGRSSLVLVGGADLHNGIKDFIQFSNTHVLSRRGRCAAFDAEGDGIVLGEGMAAVVVKRLEDARMDGNKIYAVIKGIGSSSDGRNFSITAPSRKGETRAMAMAYKHIGILPSQVGLVEAHGTGTMVGDKVELVALTDLWHESGAVPRQTCLGAVKSQIGHTKCAAGVAGVIKAALSVYHGILPPTLHLKEPNPYYDAQTSPFVFHTRAGIWNEEERIAAVSAFGFGGSNFHAVLTNDREEIAPEFAMSAWAVELFVFRGETPKEAQMQMIQVKRLADVSMDIRLQDLAFTLATDSQKPIWWSVMASDLPELLSKIDLILTDKRDLKIFARDELKGKVAFLFPGRSSLRVNMARDLFVNFPQMRHLLRRYPEYVGLLFPEAVFDGKSLQKQEQQLQEMVHAQPIMGIVDMAIASLLSDFGIQPDMVGGHSYGELAALCFAKVFDDKHLVELSIRRAQAIIHANPVESGTMLAVIFRDKEWDELSKLLDDETEVWIAYFNAPTQVTLSGTTKGIAAFAHKCASHNIFCRNLHVAALHCPMIAHAQHDFAEAIADIDMVAPALDVWSNTTATVYPADEKQIKQRMAEHLARPVYFEEQVRGMYADGARVFVEVGPGRILSGLVEDSLGRQVVTIQPESKNNDGMTQLLRALAQYLSTGRELRWDRLFAGRKAVAIRLDDPEFYRQKPTTWRIDGFESTPVDTPPKPYKKPVLAVSVG